MSKRKKRNENLRKLVASIIEQTYTKKTDIKPTKIESTKIKQNPYDKPMYLNSYDSCYICGQEPEDDFALQKHHVSYFPEIIVFVHYQCHQKIHDPDNPMTQYIQYDEGDARKFYEKKNKIMNNSNTIT